MTTHARPNDWRSLRAIALVEGSKGMLALLGAISLALIGPAPLLHGLYAVIDHIHLDPAHSPLARLSHAINPHSVHLAVLAVGAYGVVHLIEAWGLWRSRTWASWLGCVTAAIYLPFEINALIEHRGWLEATILIINLVVVWILARDLVRRAR